MVRYSDAVETGGFRGGVRRLQKTPCIDMKHMLILDIFIPYKQQPINFEGLHPPHPTAIIFVNTELY